MRIGELARAADTQVETIRYYEGIGLLPAVVRTDANYRVYGVRHLERLLFIRHCRALQITLDEVRVLLRYKDAPPSDCSEVHGLLDGHIALARDRIRTLQDLERQLHELRGQCSDDNQASPCGILHELAHPAPPALSAGPGHGHGHAAVPAFASSMR